MKPKGQKTSSKPGFRSCRPETGESAMRSMSPVDTVVIGAGPLPLGALTAIARAGARVELAETAAADVARARDLVETWVREGRAVYGVTTGFGALCEVAITEGETRALQENILMSHAAGVGDPLPAGSGPRRHGGEGAGPFPGTCRGEVGNASSPGRPSQLRGLPGGPGEGLRGRQRRPGAHGPPRPGPHREG